MDTARLSIRLTPRAARDEVASRLRVPRSDVRVVAGQTSRLKVVAVDGLTIEAVRRRLEAD